MRRPARIGCSAVVAALEPGRSSWTAPLDVVRLGPDDDATDVTARQLRDLVGRLLDAGHHRPGDPDILVVCDAGYDVTRLAFLLADLPVQICGRLRSDRVFRLPVPPRPPKADGRPPRHGPEFRLADPASWPDPAVTTSTATTRYGQAVATAWDRPHPRLTHRGAWEGHPGQLPILEGTLIRLAVDWLPGERNPKPLWLWCSTTAATATDVNRWWQAFLRRFDLEHTFRLFKQTLGWTAPRLRDPAAADRWTWLILAAYTQLRLARHPRTKQPPHDLRASQVKRQAKAPCPRRCSGASESPTRVRTGPSAHSTASVSSNSVSARRDRQPWKFRRKRHSTPMSSTPGRSRGKLSPNDLRLIL
jgi:hypothetical protein